ncbi:unnamed protein product, partial [Prorocentrum cordatum]
LFSAKRPRRPSEGAAGPGPAPAPAPAGDLSSSPASEEAAEEVPDAARREQDAEAVLQQLVRQGAAVRARHAAAASARERCRGELRDASEAARAAASSAEQASARLQQAAAALETEQQQLQCFEEVHRYCQKVQTKAHFREDFKGEFAAVAARLSEARARQGACEEEAAAELQKQRGAADAARQECEKRQPAEAAARGALEAADAEAEAAQGALLKLQELERSAEALKRCLSEEERLCESSRAAAAEDERAAAALARHELWTSDLQNLFDGRPVRDAAAVCRSLEAALPSGDMVPVIIRALIADRDRVDVQSSTGLQVRELVGVRLEGVAARLRARAAEGRDARASAEALAAQAAEHARRCERQLRALMRRWARGDDGSPGAGTAAPGPGGVALAPGAPLGRGSAEECRAIAARSAG